MAGGKEKFEDEIVGATSIFLRELLPAMQEGNECLYVQRRQSIR